MEFTNKMITYTEEQQRRLGELGAEPSKVNEEFENTDIRNKTFQLLESNLVELQHKRLDDLYNGERRPFILSLEEKISQALRNEGFLQVHTPLIMTKKRLEKMGVFEGSIMEKQVFWIDTRRCLRPMLAPNLYEYMVELGKLRPRPIRFFEIGPCFRRETQGQKHANEFTMLNLVEMGVPEGQNLKDQLLKWGKLVLETAGIDGWKLINEDSTVYGETDDFVDKKGMELGSSAIGPHPLDAEWGIMENWVGIGFGLERLTMAATNETNMAKAGRSLSYLNGIRLHL